MNLDPHEVKVLYESGSTFAELQRRFRCSDHRIRMILVEQGVTIRKVGGAGNFHKSKIKDPVAKNCDAPHLPFPRRCVLEPTSEQCEYCKRDYTVLRELQSCGEQDPWGSWRITCR